MDILAMKLGPRNSRDFWGRCIFEGNKHSHDWFSIQKHLLISFQTERPTTSHQLYVAPDELTFIQSRVEINPLLIDEYAEMMQASTAFEAAQAVQDEQCE